MLNFDDHAVSATGERGIWVLMTTKKIVYRKEKQEEGKEEQEMAWCEEQNQKKEKVHTEERK